MNFKTARIHFLGDSIRHRRCLGCLSYLKTLLINLSLQTTLAVNLLLNKEGK